MKEHCFSTCKLLGRPEKRTKKCDPVQSSNGKPAQNCISPAGPKASPTRGMAAAQFALLDLPSLADISLDGTKLVAFLKY